MERGAGESSSQLGKWRAYPGGEVLKMFRRLLCLYRGSISITKPKSELQPHLALQ